MTARTIRRPAPGGLVARLLKAPTALYARGWGRVLGHRFLALSHRGRRSGRVYTTVLEVVRWRPGTREAVVVSGFGPQSQWYRNVLAGGVEEVQIARLRFHATARVLEPPEAVSVLADYERRNRIAGPIVRAVLGRLVGFAYDGSADAREQLVRMLPFVAFTPREDLESMPR